MKVIALICILLVSDFFIPPTEVGARPLVEMSHLEKGGVIGFNPKAPAISCGKNGEPYKTCIPKKPRPCKINNRCSRQPPTP
uniref:Uncharacterized protein n=1 Tax=Nelumbo nucifera TaxID=4432 RepID=A0A822ZCM2_NELNU|nr:TPA_asm: hypothetical protein HUJ06_013611 [Nelumbo nucifera]